MVRRKSIIAFILAAAMILSAGTAMGMAPIGAQSNVQEDASASVQFSDQETDGTTVVVDSVELSEGGFLTIHDSSLLEGDATGSVIGVSEYLEAGTHENVTVHLYTGVEGAEFNVSELQEEEELIAMPHFDTNGNETYDFVSSEGQEDGAYTDENGAVVDQATVTPAEDGHDCPCPDDNATDDNVTDDNVTDDNVTDDNVTDDNVTDDNVTDDNVTDDNVTDDNVTDDNVTDDNVTDDNITDGNVTDGDEVNETQRAFQLDFAFGETIQQLGADDNAFYAEQDNRLIQAVSVTEDGEVTEGVRHQAAERESPHSDAMVSYEMVEFDSETQEATVHVSVSEESTEDVTLTLAAYEFPEGQTTFSFDTADQQQLVADQTVTLSPGEETTLTIQLDGAMDDNVTDDNVTDDNVTDDNVTDDNVTDDNVTDDNVTDDNVTDDNVTDDNVTDDNVTDDNVTDDNVTDDNVTDDNATDNDTTGDVPAGDVPTITVASSNVGDGVSVEDEQLVLENDGDEAIDMGGWTLESNSSDVTFTFPEGTTLEAGETLTINTAEGEDTDDTVHLGSDEPIWTEDGGYEITIRNADGEPVFLVSIS